MSALVRRVVARHLKALDDTEVRELHTLLATFNKLVDGLGDALKESPDDYYAQMLAGAELTVNFSFLRRTGAGVLFRGLLKGYQMDSKTRKAIERANKIFSKTRMRRPKPEKAFDALKKYMAEMQLFQYLAKRLLADGKFHSEEGSSTLMKAGPFTLVNTGGFSDKMMEDVGKVVAKAGQLLSSHGLSKVCYGNVQVTNTVSSATRELAFYTTKRDELFIRANLRGKQGPALRSVIHELGHRLHFKFLKSQNREIKSIYEAIGDRDRQLLWELREDPTKRPKPGDEFRSGKKVLVVTPEVLVERKGKTWIVMETKAPKLEFGVLPPGPNRAKEFYIPLDEWFKHTGQLAYVTPYATTNHEENFAEMIAHYCLGKLPDDQVEMLKTVI